MLSPLFCQGLVDTCGSAACGLPTASRLSIESDLCGSWDIQTHVSYLAGTCKAEADAFLFLAIILQLLLNYVLRFSTYPFSLHSGR